MAKHKTFFGKIFGSAWDLIKGGFNKADGGLLEMAINITNKIKNALNSGVVDILTAIIPTDIDDKIVELLRKKVPILLMDELLLKSLSDPNNPADPEFVAQQLLESFGGLNDEKKEKFYTSIAAMLYKFLQEHKNGEKVTFGQAATFVETAYQAWKASQE